MTRRVLILGANGKIGSHAAEAFWNKGWEVRRFERGTDMVAAAQGCDVIVNGLNPPNYHNWAKLIPEITAEVIAAAKANGATVILPGNVYNFGATPGIWDEHTPHRPVARKGRIRVEMERAYRDSGVRTIILRAGNFLDPNRQNDVFSLVISKDVAKGKLTRLGGADVMQSYAFLPDWARAAEALAAKRIDLQPFEDVPFPGQNFTITQLASMLEGMTGRSYRISGFPWWLMRLASPVWELARELVEMRYLNETSHELGGDKFARLLPDFQITDVPTAIATCLPTDVHPNQMVRPGGHAIAAE